MRGKSAVTTRRFDKQFRKLSPKLQKLFMERLQLFLADPFDARLHTHKLTGVYEGRGSFNVTGDVRVVFDDEAYDDKLLLVAIGTHSQLY